MARTWRLIQPNSEPPYALPPPEERHLGQLAPPAWPAPGWWSQAQQQLGLYNVTEFGDGVGTGGDDTQAFLDAIAGAKRNSIILLPPAISGSYRISATLDLANSYCHLVGCGWGSVIEWIGNNTTPVILASQAWTGGKLAHLRIKGQPGVAGNKATAAIKLISPSGAVDYLDVIEGVHIGPIPSETQASTFSRGIWLDGSQNFNNDGHSMRNVRIAYCDTGVEVGGSQFIDNEIDNIRVVNCGTAFQISAHTTLRNVECSNSSVADFNVDTAALVRAIQYTSEGAARALTIAGQSHFHWLGGYFQASSGITAGGDFIAGTDNANDQVVTLEDWQLTQTGGYAGPTPTIKLQSAAAGSGSKALYLRRCRGVVATLTAANLDVVPVVSSNYVMHVEGEVYDGTANTRRVFRNVLTATTDTVDFQRNDFPAANVIRLGAVKILQGAGSPESVVTAPLGSLYLRNDGGVGTTLYVKSTGTGNTGWNPSTA